MMKIRNYLLVSISYFSLCSLAQADISTMDNRIIFTHTSNTHLTYYPQLLSSSILPQTQSEQRASFASISLAVTEGVKLPQLASVCFITDAGNCSGNKYGGANTPDNSSSGGTPNGSSSGSSSSGGDACAPNDAWCLDNQKRCEKEGYTQTSCNSVQNPVNFCPYDNTYFEKCVCKPNLQTCTKPYYGVGESCGGKYASCQLDNARACNEDGYTQTGSCPAGQTINQKCPYDPAYFDKCVCRSDLISCPSPLQGTGVSCGGKYQSCQCPSNYQSCNCGAAAGASACTWNGVTKYSSCKACCSDSCPSGSYEYEVGTGRCGGGTTRNGCNTKTCYYPRYKCPCEDSAYTKCNNVGTVTLIRCYDANSVLWDYICEYNQDQECISMDENCYTRTYSQSKRIDRYF